jgi:hypothetical protein
LAELGRLVHDKKLSGYVKVKYQVLEDLFFLSNFGKVNRRASQRTRRAKEAHSGCKGKEVSFPELTGEVTLS